MREKGSNDGKRPARTPSRGRMSREVRQPAGLPVPRFPYSPVVLAGDLVFIAGQVAVDASGDVVAGGVAEQTRQVMTNVATCLEAAGCSMDDVVKTTVFLTDLGNFEAFNEEYARHLRPPYPARSTVRAGLAAGLLVEIEAVARRPEPA
jgi:2-iminobutanoate/2-iminopropanoate deaminase